MKEYDDGIDLRNLECYLWNVLSLTLPIRPRALPCILATANCRFYRSQRFQIKAIRMHAVIWAVWGSVWISSKTWALILITFNRRTSWDETCNKRTFVWPFFNFPILNHVFHSRFNRFVIIFVSNTIPNSLFTFTSSKQNIWEKSVSF